MNQLLCQRFIRLSSFFQSGLPQCSSWKDRVQSFLPAQLTVSPELLSPASTEGRSNLLALQLINQFRYYAVQVADEGKVRGANDGGLGVFINGKMATMMSELCMPARCCTAPEMPQTQTSCDCIYMTVHFVFLRDYKNGVRFIFYSFFGFP
jgi:hypothetical protein